MRALSPRPVWMAETKHMATLPPHHDYITLYLFFEHSPGSPLRCHYFQAFHLFFFISIVGFLLSTRPPSPLVLFFFLLARSYFSSIFFWTGMVEPVYLFPPLSFLCAGCCNPGFFLRAGCCNLGSFSAPAAATRCLFPCRLLQPGIFLHAGYRNPGSFSMPAIATRDLFSMPAIATRDLSSMPATASRDGARLDAAALCLHILYVYRSESGSGNFVPDARGGRIQG